MSCHQSHLSGGQQTCELSRLTRQCDRNGLVGCTHSKFMHSPTEVAPWTVGREGGGVGGVAKVLVCVPTQAHPCNVSPPTSAERAEEAPRSKRGSRSREGSACIVLMWTQTHGHKRLNPCYGNTSIYMASGAQPRAEKFADAQKKNMMSIQVRSGAVHKHVALSAKHFQRPRVNCFAVPAETRCSTITERQPSERQSQSKK